MENVVALEKLVIVPNWSWDCHHSGSELGKRERKKEAKARRHANMHIKNRVPSTVEFTGHGASYKMVEVWSWVGHGTLDDGDERLLSAALEILAEQLLSEE
ncbi:F-box/FBD/LRR-repeat protein [Prunus yedoensis var. nudiflora]|uniref:F-box/FBD/LRR-repeat protein n=1 Tax=Prunus yedoensis var. nudiflora TaxID=2094558 RepID=A0A314Y5J6_PRUYE|nr:F-box/FBD/LRR-repeat protein [Prunus yedoensis var. nudiflora]